jgi:plasmid stabilization system protein ParE
MRVIIEETAIADIGALAAWITMDSPQSGRLVVEKILHTIPRLELFPKMAHEGRDEGTYERGVPGTPYIAGRPSRNDLGICVERRMTAVSPAPGRAS